MKLQCKQFQLVGSMLFGYYILAVFLGAVEIFSGRLLSPPPWKKTGTWKSDLWKSVPFAPVAATANIINMSAAVHLRHYHHLHHH